MIRRTHALAAIAVLGAGLLVLSACAPTKTDTGPTTDPNSLPLTGWTAVDPSTLTQGGTLNLATSDTPTGVGSWNPNTGLGANAEAVVVESPTAGSPVRIKTDGSWEADPNYATSVALVSDSPQVVEVKLNEKAVWEDGTPITASDYMATFAALSGKDSSFDIASSAGFDKVTAFDVKSDYDFTFTFGTPYADWANLLVAAAVPKAIASDAKAWSTGFADKPLPSSGPFIYTGVDNTAFTFTATPNPKWWGDKPKLDKITFTKIDQETQAQSFANSELQAVDVQTADAYLAAQKKAGAVVLRSSGLTYSQVTFNGTAAPLDDVKVREAIAHGINRDIIGKAANEPLGAPSAPDGNYIFMPGQAGYEDTAGTALGYDPAKAKQILTDDGWTNAGGKWTKNGTDLTVSVIVPQGTASNALRAQQIQASLKDIDIAVTINEVPGDSYFTDITDGKFQLATFGWQGTAFPISTAESLFSPEQKPGDQSGQNYSFVSDPALADLWAQANQELDPAKRLALTSQINDKVAAVVGMLPLYAYPNVTVVDGNLANYGPATFESIDWTKVGFKK